MDIKIIIKPVLFLAGSLFALQLNAASIGTYAFADNAIADQLISGQGQTYNGSSWYFGSGSDWLSSTGGAWQASDTPDDVSDTSVSSYLAATNSTGAVQLDLGFSQSTVLNSNGSDIAFFFLWDQSMNAATVSINGFSQDLSFSNVFNALGTQQVANDVIWDNSSFSNVQLMAGVIDLNDFGFSLGDSLNSSITIDMQSNNDSNPMALALVAGLNSTTDPITSVPIPAALYLLLSGLVTIGLFRRRSI